MAISCEVHETPAGTFAEIECDCGHKYTVWMVPNGCWGSDVDFCPNCDHPTSL